MAKIIVKAPFYKPGHKTEKGQSRGGYAQYIGTREGVEILRSGMAGYIGERHGSHGLFSDEGVDVSLSKISEEIDKDTTSCSFSSSPLACAVERYLDSNGVTSISPTVACG